MRHYFCLDEERVIYLGVKEHLCGIGGERKRTVVWTERPFDGKLERPIHDLIREWGLKGKRVDLVLEAGVKRAVFSLPPGNARQMRRMAEYMLRARKEETEDLAAAVELFRGKNGMPMGTVYYTQRKFLEKLKETLEREGVHPGRALVRMSALSFLAGSLGREQALICIEIRETRVKLYGIWKGCCVCFKESSLRPKTFVRLGGEKILWEEIAALAEMLVCEMKELAAADTVILDRPFGPRAREAAPYLEERLGIPCRIVDFRREIRCLKKKAGRRMLAFPNFSRGAGARSLEKAGMAFVLCNCLAAIAVSGAFLVRERKVREEFSAFQAERDADHESLYREAEALDQSQKARTELERRYGKKAGIESRIYAVKQAMGAVGRAKGVRYESEEGTFFLQILTDSPEDIPALEERLRQTGEFIRVSHVLWERDEDSGQIQGQLEMVLWEAEDEGD